MDYSAPVKLTSSRAWRTYLGGSQIDRIHGITGSSDTHFPEEWIMSTVLARNAGREDILEGMCYLEGEQRISLKDYIEADPCQALGPGRGSSVGVLVKIIDAAERLTVQVHPDKAQALRLFNSPYGKTECWHILGGRSIDGVEPSIYMGFMPGISREEWKRCFDQQDIAAMLGHMHHFPVRSGETYLIKGGVPHAIGQGCLLVEIQEPTDLTIRTERVTPMGLKVADMSCHQGLGFERMFDCFSYDGITGEQALKAWQIRPELIQSAEGLEVRQIIGYDSTDCFKLLEYRISSSCIISGGEFCGLYVLEGQGSLNGDPIKPGDQFFVPCGSRTYHIDPAGSQSLRIFRFFGPRLYGSDKT